MKWAGLAAGGLIAAVVGVIVFTLLFSGPPPTVEAATCGGVVGAVQLDAEQKQNAAIIIQIASQRQLPQQAAIVGITAALDESSLHNLNHGDRDSLGLFQQRPSQGWGSPAEIMNPAYAAGKFYDHLVNVAGWETMTVQLAAQAVQRSAYADGSNYAKFVDQAKAIVGSFQPAQTCSAPAGGPMQAGSPMSPDCPHPAIGQPYGPTSFSLEPAAHGAPHFHTGIDLDCPAGTPIHNVGDPGVAHVTSGCNGFMNACGGGWGNNVDVEITNPNGHFFVRYAHMVSVAVADGAQVKVGDVLGAEGTTGFSTGPHLHFEVDRDRPNVQDSIDPAGWLSI